jgi:Tol biopolymer transport system component
MRRALLISVVTSFVATACPSSSSVSQGPSASATGPAVSTRLAGQLVLATQSDPRAVSVMAPDGTNVHQVLAGGPEPSPGSFVPVCCSGASLSPNGAKLAFVGDGGVLEVSDADGKNAQTIWTPTGATFVSAGAPAWSPSGQQIAFIREKCIDCATSGAGVGVDVVNADGSGGHVLAPSEDVLGGLAWSPDGTRIAFGTVPTAPSTGGLFPAAIKTVSVSGGSITQILGHVLDGVGALSWAPASAILFTDRHQAVIRETDLRGTSRVALAGSGVDYWPSWAPDGVHFAAVRNGRVIIATVDGGVQATIGPEGVTYVQWGGANSRAVEVSAKFGTQFSTVVARVSLSSTDLDLSRDSATISWGDGSITRGTLSRPPGTSSEVEVRGTHTYWVPGRLRVVVTLSNTATGDRQTLAGQVVVSSVYTGLGDSYSSGEGAGWPPGQSAPNLPGCDWSLYQDPSGVLYSGSTDHVDDAFTLGNDSGCHYPPHNPTGDTCHRAVTAYAHVVERLLAIAGLTLHFAACSGAIVEDMYSDANSIHGGETHDGETPQLRAIGPDTSLVTLTIGGNNVKFAPIAKNCVLATLSQGDAECIKQDARMLGILGYDTTAGGKLDGHFSPVDSSTGIWAQTHSAAGDSFDRLLSNADTLAGTEDQDGTDLHDALVLLYREIKVLAPGARILVLGYPAFFPGGGTGTDCEHFSALEQRWVNDRIDLVNRVVRDAVDESGVAQFVDVYSALAGHEECTGDQSYTVDPVTGHVSSCGQPGRWINGIDVFHGALGSPESLHPNPCGHQTEGRLAATEYQQPNPYDTFTLRPGQNHLTLEYVVSGTDRLDMSAEWNSPTAPDLTLVDPSGATHDPFQSGPVYATWDVRNPAQGRWVLTETNSSTTDSGVIRGSVTVAHASVPTLPPAGQVEIVQDHCSALGSTATLRASVNPSLDPTVANYAWFDDKGSPQATTGSKNDTITMSSRRDHYKVILRTTGTNGQYRYTVWDAGGNC